MQENQQNPATGIEISRAFLESMQVDDGFFFAADASLVVLA